MPSSGLNISSLIGLHRYLRLAVSADKVVARKSLLKKSQSSARTKIFKKTYTGEVQTCTYGLNFVSCNFRQADAVNAHDSMINASQSGGKHLQKHL